MPATTSTNTQTDSQLLDLQDDAKYNSDSSETSTGAAYDPGPEIGSTRPFKNVKGMSVEDLKKTCDTLTKQNERVKAELWDREAIEKAQCKRKRVFMLPERKRYKVDKKLEEHKDTKEDYEQIRSKTDTTTDTARELYEKQLEQEKNILSLQSQRDHSQTMVVVWTKRLKTIRSQLAVARASQKKTQVAARKAKAAAAVQVRRYKQMRRVLKHKVSLMDNAAHLAKKEAELESLKRKQRACLERAPLETPAPPVAATSAPFNV